MIFFSKENLNEKGEELETEDHTCQWLTYIQLAEILKLDKNFDFINEKTGLLMMSML